MANGHSKIDIAAAELSAEAAAKVIADKLAEQPASVVAEAPVKKAPPKPVPAKAAPAKPVPVKAVKAAVAPKPAFKPAAKPAPKPVSAAAPTSPAPTSPAPTSPAPVAMTPKSADAASVTTPNHTLKQLKDKIMDTTTNTATDFTAKLRDGAADMQSRAKAAYEKGAEMTADMTAFHKGNFDALVEAGKVLAAGMQDLGRTTVEDARSAAETATADVKAMVAVKSPTELFQLQGEIARRNLDAIVAKTSKNAETMMKLANDMFAPLSTRASVAMERLTKAA